MCAPCVCVRVPNPVCVCVCVCVYLYPYSLVLLLDSNGGDAGKVAAALSAQGFGSVYTVEGGFAGWNKAGLATKQTNIVTGQVLPALGLGGGSQRKSSAGTVIDVTPNRFLLP